jgi:GNAT superfamily N-acetyltransferase
VRGEQPTWVGELAGDIVGFMVAKRASPHPVLALPASMVITDAYVVEEYRRRGIGRLLYGTVVAFARSEHSAMIEVGTLALDTRALSFWRSVGCVPWRVTLVHTLV